MPTGAYVGLNFGCMKAIPAEDDGQKLFCFGVFAVEEAGTSLTQADM